MSKNKELVTVSVLKAVLNETLDKKLAVINTIIEENERLKKRVKELDTKWRSRIITHGETTL